MRYPGGHETILSVKNGMVFRSDRGEPVSQLYPRPTGCPGASAPNPCRVRTRSQHLRH